MAELLAPAGDMESLYAALKSGADSVYLGAKAFSARAGAKNFDDAELMRALDEAHGCGAFVYVALNTLLFDSELKGALGMAEALYRMGADALIVQDTGFAALLRAYFPDMPLHASTQACIHDAGGLEFASRLGFSRAVLSRELPLSDIAALASSPVELEVFVHGALCSAFSGGCLFSSLVGGRSGNRGACAQPCRLPYRFDQHQKPAALLSLRDLCAIEHIADLEKAGVKAFKIEGRMRGAAYVGAVTRAYRNVLDGAPASEQRALLEGAAHHGGYCPGYLFGDEGLAETERPASWRMPDIIKPAPYSRDIPLSAWFELSEGHRAKLRVAALGQEAAVFGAMPESAQSAPLTIEKIEAALSKLGDTPFALASLSARIGGNLFLPAAKLNGLRREAISALTEAIRASRRRVGAEAKNALEQNAPESRRKDTTVEAHSCRGELCSPAVLRGARDIPRANTVRPYRHRLPRNERALTAQIVSPEQAQAACGADMIIFRPLDWRRAVEELLAVRSAIGQNAKLLLRLPSVLRRADWAIAAPAIEKAREIADGAVASNAGQAAYLLERFPLVLGGHELNITNAESARFWHDIGVRACASAELTIRRARDILELCPDIIAYGRVPLMTLLHCPMRDSGGDCRDCAGNGGLRDRMSENFPLEREQLGSCHVSVLNAHRLDLLRKWPEFGFSPRLLFSDESAGDVAEIVNAYRNAMDGKGITRTFGETTGRYYAKSV